MDLVIRLPIVLQRKIKMYYLSYGTNACNIIKYIIQNHPIKLNPIQPSMKINSDTTLWDMVVYNHECVKCNVQHGKIPYALLELELVSLYNNNLIMDETLMDENAKQYFIQFLMSMLKSRFTEKYKSLLC